MNKFIKGAFILTVAGFIVKGIGAVSKVLLARLLGAEGIGLYQMAYPIYQLIVSLATAGLPVAISIMVADKLANKDMLGAQKVFKFSLTVLAILGVVSAIGLYGMSEFFIRVHWVLDERAHMALLALAPSLLFVTLLSCFRGYFQGFQNMFPTGLSQIGEQSIRVIGMVALVWLLLPWGLDWAAAGATLATLPGVIAGLVILMIFYYRHRGERQRLLAAQNPNLTAEGGWPIVRRLFILAIPVSLANVMLPIVSSIDLLIVPARLVHGGLSIEDATTMFGYLTGMATSLVNLPIIVTTSLAIGLVPSISEAFALKDMRAVRERTASAMKIANVFTLAAFVGLCVLSTPISSMLYATPKAGPPMAILSLSIFLLGIQQVTTGILQGLGKTAIPMLNLVLGAVVKIALSWYLTAIPSLGVNGAAWATNADFFVAALGNLWFVRHYVGYTIPWKDSSKLALCVIVMGAVTWALYHGIVGFIGNAGAVLVSIIIAVALYGMSLLVTKAVTVEEMHDFPMIGKRLRRWKRSENK